MDKATTKNKPAKPKLKAAESAKKTPDAPRNNTKVKIKDNLEGNSANAKAVWQDALWLVLLVLSLYFALTLFGFKMSDPAWSRSIPDHGQLANFGGLLGAYLSDVAYYCFGLSVWWLLAVSAVWLYRHFRPILDEETEPYRLDWAMIGVAVLLFSSPVLEVFLFQEGLADSLPYGAGGLFGRLVYQGFTLLLGFSGSLLIMSVVFVAGLSLLLQISWLDVLERIGLQFERVYERVFARHKKYVLAQEPNTQARRSAQQASSIVAEPVEPPKGSSSNRKVAINVAQPVPTVPVQRDSKPVVVGDYSLPALSLLSEPTEAPQSVDPEKLNATAELIKSKLSEFGIQVEVVSATAGPVITRYEIEPAQGVKGSQIVGLTKDLARALTVQSVRVVETIAGKNTMGIELPSEKRQNVLLQEVLASPAFAHAESKLTVALGKDIAGAPIMGDLAKMPHVLVAGMTGSGKSVGVNAMIMSILFKATPDEVRMIMIDPKAVEFMMYNHIPHLLCPIITDMSHAGHALNWCVAEMEKRNKLMSQIGVKNLAGFNDKIRKHKEEGKTIPNPFSLTPDDPEPLETMPQIVLVIDELADLMMTEKKAVEDKIVRIAQKARSAGIHMIIATQRPSADVITGLIKTNVPTRMAFTVQSKIDSRIILDQMGAESLLRMGDLLFSVPGGSEPTRLQSPYASDDEIQAVVDFLKEQGEPNYVDGILTGEATLEAQQMVNPAAAGGSHDELFDQAVALVLETRKTSISFVQRHFRIGYNRAANLMQELEDAGILSSADVGGARKILARKDSLDL